MSYIIEFWVLPAVLSIAIGSAVSWALVRWLPVAPIFKTTIYCLLFVSFFTPIFFPITGAGIIVFPMLGLGIETFWEFPQNFFCIGISIIFSILSARKLFMSNSKPSEVSIG